MRDVASILVFIATASAQVCTDSNSAEGLSMAVDAAIMELQGQKGWFHSLRTNTGYTDAMSVYSCSPDSTKWVYPKESEARGALKRVLEAGKVRVAGVAWKRCTSEVCAADYTVTKPKGFWPDYMDAIALKMTAHYGKTIAVERVYYDNSGLVVDAVSDGKDVDMSEPYYYLSGFNGNKPRIEDMAFSCVTAGLASAFFTKKGSGVSNVDQLFDKVKKGPNRAVGFIGQGNYDAVSAMLPSNTAPTFYADSGDMVANVKSGALVAGYVSEGKPPSPEAFDIFETGIVSPRVALFHKDEVVCDSGVIFIPLIIVAIVALVLALLIGFIISKERARKPLFMPLLRETSVTATENATVSNKA